MAVACKTDDKTKEIIYTLRFNTTDKIIHITKEKLDCIPYLSALIIHNNDFVSIENENGEYVLNSQIRYDWFMPILQAIITQHPSALFTELPREAYLWGMLQLYDYLCLNPIPVPLLKDQHLVQLNCNNILSKNLHIEYIRANNLLEVRDTAVQFIIALTKNEYNVDDCQTLRHIFSLIMVILSSPNIFGLRICHHTLTVVKKLYFSLFSYKQQQQLQNVQQSIQSIKARFLKYSYDDHEKLPESFKNAFVWKGVYTVIETNDSVNCHSNCNKTSTDNELSFGIHIRSYTDLNTFYHLYPRSISIFSPSYFDRFRFFLKYDEMMRKKEDAIRREERHLWLILHSSIGKSNLYNILPVLRQRVSLMIRNPDDKELYIYQIKQEQKKNEARLARSGCFNTLPKQLKIDKFKHRSRPKLQKYR